MILDCPEKIAAAQIEYNCMVNGLEVRRLRYGDEPDDWGADQTTQVKPFQQFF